VHPEAVVADAAFGPVHRDPPTPPAHARETVPDGMPLHRWVSVASGPLGAALLSDGLAEAVVAPGRLGVTLLRAIGELSRARLPERPGHAGWPAATPAAQAQGRFRAVVALWLHGPHGDPLWPTLSRHADDFLLPLTGTPWREPLPPSAQEGGVALAGPRLVGDGLEASTVTLTEDGAAVVLRAVNLTERPVRGAWVLPDPAPHALPRDQAGWWVVPCRMDGMPEGPARPVRNGHVPLEVPPRGIVTVQLRREAPSA
jgi:alpha-mannosidase